MLDKILESLRIETDAQLMSALRKRQVLDEDRQQQPGDATVRVDVSLLDSLMNLIGELVLVRNQLVQLAAPSGPVPSTSRPSVRAPFQPVPAARPAHANTLKSPSPTPSVPMKRHPS